MQTAFDRCCGDEMAQMLHRSKAQAQAHARHLSTPRTESSMYAHSGQREGSAGVDDTCRSRGGTLPLPDCGIPLLLPIRPRPRSSSARSRSCCTQTHTVVTATASSTAPPVNAVEGETATTHQQHLLHLLGLRHNGPVGKLKVHGTLRPHRDLLSQLLRVHRATKPGRGGHHPCTHHTRISGPPTTQRSGLHWNRDGAYQGC